jgi:uncharacterized YccA/Bax inhibitor family protein
MPNPILTDKRFEQAEAEARAGWAAPDPRSANLAAEAALAGQQAPPTHPSLPGTYDRMTMGGVVTATAVLITLLLVAAAFGWQQVDVVRAGDGTVLATNFPSWLIIPMLVGVGLVFLAVFKPHLAKFVAPVYALTQGLVVGAISAVYEAQWDGIVVQAVGATLGVFLVTLAMYALRIVRVTSRFRSTVIAATVGLMVFYLVAFVLSLFGVDFAMFTSPSWFGIGFSVFVAGLAAFNLFLDYDIIERGIAGGAPKSFEWMASLGLIVTIVWLYLEILRLLGKLRSR